MFFKYVRIISETRLKCHKTELTMMHTFLNRKLTIFVCLAFGGLATGRAQVQPLPIIPPNALVQTYTGRLAHTLLNGYVKNDDARLSDSRTPQGTAGGDLSGTYPNPTIKASVNLSGNPTVAGKLTVNGTDESLIKGNLRLKGNGNYGNKLNFGDGDYVYLHEATDDNLTVKAKNIELAPTSAVTAPTPATTDNSTKIATTAYVQNNLANFANVPIVIAAGQIKRIIPTNNMSNWRITSQAIGSASIENHESFDEIRGIVTVSGMTDDCIVIVYGVNGSIDLTQQHSNQFEIAGTAWGNTAHTNYYTVLKLQ